MKKKPQKNWCVVNTTKQPPMMECKRCGKMLPLELPMELRKVTKMLDGFELMHSLCEEKADPNQMTMPLS